jgi:hypothetical protein
LPETVLVLSGIERDITIYIHRSSFKVPVILSTGSQQILIYEISRKSRCDSRVVPCGQTEELAGVIKVNVSFRNSRLQILREYRSIIFPAILEVLLVLLIKGGKEVEDVR